MKIWRCLFFVLFAWVIFALLIPSLPGISRYLKIRQM
ncbi:DUF6893 family small protein [Methylacidiphilum caldifontis]